MLRIALNHSLIIIPHTTLMNSLAHTPKLSPEGHFLGAAVAIGTSAVLLLVIQVVGRFDLPERLSGAAFWA